MSYHFCAQKSYRNVASHYFRSLHELQTIWTKDGIPIENAQIVYSFNDSWNRTLALILANLTYTGVYTCHVDLRGGGYPSVNASAKIDVFGENYHPFCENIDFHTVSNFFLKFHQFFSALWISIDFPDTKIQPLNYF